MFIDDDLELVHLLLDRSCRDVGTMQSAFAASDLATVRRLAHVMRGACGALGFEALCDAARRIEHACIRDMGETIGPVLAELQAELASQCRRFATAEARP